MIRTSESKTSSGHCQIRLQLAEQFATATRLYYEAVVELTRASSHLPDRDYDRLWGNAIDAQECAEVAGTAFQRHVELHRCGTRLDAESGSTDVHENGSGARTGD